MKTIPILPGIALHELRTADAADIFAAIDGERAYLGRWLPFVQFTRSEEDSLRFVRFRPHRNRVVDVYNAVFILFCHTFVIRGGRMMLLKQFAPTS